VSSCFQITKSALILAIAIGSVSLASAQTTRTAYRDAYYAGAARVQQPQRITRLTTARPPAVTTCIRPATEEKTCANS